MSNSAQAIGTGYKKVVIVPPKKHLSRPKNAERAMVINLILDGLMPKKDRTLWKDHNADFINSLVTTPNIPYLRKILDLVPYAVHSADIRFIIDEATEFYRRDFDTLHANREFLHEGIRMEWFRESARTLCAALGYKTGELIPSLPAHLAAEKCFNETFDWSGHSDTDILFPPPENHYTTSDICPLVEKYYSEVDVITTSMTEHGVTHASGLLHILEGKSRPLANGSL